MRTAEQLSIPLAAFGALEPISRTGGQGRVHSPALVPPRFAGADVVVKVYRRAPEGESAAALLEMIRWERSLAGPHRAALRSLTAWPLALVGDGGVPAGIVMGDLRPRFGAPFEMPSGRRDTVLLALEHLLGDDGYLYQRGLPVRLDTGLRVRIAERICGALAFLHQHAIVVGDIAPSNVLVAVPGASPESRGVEVCLIDCDSMVFRGRQALPAVETADWTLPAQFAAAPASRATDAYKLALVVLRLLARSHDARTVAPHLRQIPVELRDLLHRALTGDPANRPAAGEWQRALLVLLAAGGLDHRYPGPAPVGRRAAAPAAVARAAAAPAATAPAAAAPAAAAPAAAAPAAGAGRAGGHGSLSGRTGAPAPVRRLSVLTVRQATIAGGAAAPGRPASALWLRRGVAALWVVALAAVLVLVLSRVIDAATPVGSLTTTVYYQPSAGATQP